VPIDLIARAPGRSLCPAPHVFGIGGPTGSWHEGNHRRSRDSSQHRIEGDERSAAGAQRGSSQWSNKSCGLNLHRTRTEKCTITAASLPELNEAAANGNGRG